MLLQVFAPKYAFSIAFACAGSGIFLWAVLLIAYLRTRKPQYAGRPLSFVVLLSCVTLGAVLAGCSTLGLASPQSFDEQLAEAYGVHTAVVSATATALTTGAITVAEATAAQTQETGARAMLDAAKAAETANPTGAASDLQLATTALTALQSYLNSVQKPAAAPATAP